MTVHIIKPERAFLHGSFSRDLKPVLTIESGDTIRYQTLDSGWGFPSGNGSERLLFEGRNRDTDAGHALCGPLYIRGAKKGMTLQVNINELVPGPYGFTSAGQVSNWQNQQLGLTNFKEIILRWNLNKTKMTGTCEINNREFTVDLKPFMGVMGMPPDEAGNHPTWPPRYCGGNIDCKELVTGSSLFLPISVEGALFSVGDGHATQGDGEVSCQAIECPMELVDLGFHILDDKKISMPKANTPAGWITFGFDEDLNKATVIALDGMLNLMGELYGINRVEAIALGSSVIDLRITQIVNGVKGVHACLPHRALR